MASNVEKYHGCTWWPAMLRRVSAVSSASIAQRESTTGGRNPIVKLVAPILKVGKIGSTNFKGGYLRGSIKSAVIIGSYSMPFLFAH